MIMLMTMILLISIRLELTCEDNNYKMTQLNENNDHGDMDDNKKN